MDRRRFLAGSAAAATAALGPTGAAVAQGLSLNAISAYLNDLVTATSPFTQVNADGSISTGTVYIRRPGRMRFEYDPPEQLLVLASGGQLAIFDGRSTVSTPEQYPLARTPLNLILQPRVDLGRDGMVVAHRAEGAKTVVTAQDPDRPEIGRIELVFTGEPIELRQWVVIDDTGARTTVILGALETGADLNAALFSIQSEILRRQG